MGTIEKFKKVILSREPDLLSMSQSVTVCLVESSILSETQLTVPVQSNPTSDKELSLKLQVLFQESPSTSLCKPDSSQSTLLCQLEEDKESSSLVIDKLEKPPLPSTPLSTKGKSMMAEV